MQCYINMSRELRWNIRMVWNDIFSSLPDAVRKALNWTAALLLVAFLAFALVVSVTAPDMGYPEG
jgi:hypothetical protein